MNSFAWGTCGVNEENPFCVGVNMPQKFKTEFPGVRYYEHPTRTIGRGPYKQPDKYFSIRLRVDQKLKEEGLGWASEGWNAEKAFIELGKLKEARRTGTGPRTLSERRKIAKEAGIAEMVRQDTEAKEKVTFLDIFEQKYLPNAKLNKTAGTIVREKSLFNCWLKNSIGEKPLKDIAETDLERIKKRMKQEGQKPRSISYALALVRQIFNFAIRNRIFAGLSPTKGVVFPKEDNRRMRFLTHNEANDLLEYLKKENPQLHDISLISLLCGLRLGEIISLRWNDIDFEKGFLAVKDTKNKLNRVVPMTGEVIEMLREREKRKNFDFVFSDHKGLKLKNYTLSLQFKMATDSLRLNEGISDDRDKVVSHSLRHTFCSWLVEEGVDLYTVKELAGHKTLAMTARYSHLGDGILQRAVRKLQEGMERAKIQSRSSEVISN
jgi:integrase